MGGRSGTAEAAAPTRDLAGRHVAITGANTGIGRATALALARRGARLMLLGRSEERTRPVLEEIARLPGAAAAAFVPVDLGALASVRAAADRLQARGEPLHLLVNNAGVAGTRGLSPDGFELTFAINHLGPFLLTMRLLERLRASAPARIVNLASRAHYRAPGVDFAALRRRTASRSGFPEYCVSKLCNVLFTRELAARLAGSGVTTYAVHPGVVASDIWRHVPAPSRSLMKLFMISNEAGADTTLHCAASADVISDSGAYFEKRAVTKPSRHARDAALARRLWQESEAWTRG